MKQIFTLLLAAALGSAAIASEPAKTQAPARSAAGPAYSEQQFEAAYQHMKRMLAQMEQIKAAKDPLERQRLLNEHRQSMREGAFALRRMDCQAQPGGNCPWQERHRGPRDRMGMMEHRMDMMQMMMEQMIEHESHKVPGPRQEGPSVQK